MGYRIKKPQEKEEFVSFIDALGLKYVDEDQFVIVAEGEKGTAVQIISIYIVLREYLRGLFGHLSRKYEMKDGPGRKVLKNLLKLDLSGVDGKFYYVEQTIVWVNEYFKMNREIDIEDIVDFHLNGLKKDILLNESNYADIRSLVWSEDGGEKYELEQGEFDSVEYDIDNEQAALLEQFFGIRQDIAQFGAFRINKLDVYMQGPRILTQVDGKEMSFDEIAKIVGIEFQAALNLEVEMPEAEKQSLVDIMLILLVIEVDKVVFHRAVPWGFSQKIVDFISALSASYDLGEMLIIECGGCPLCEGGN